MRTRSAARPAPPSLPPSEWLRPGDRVALLAHGQWGLFSSAKTGIQVMRYSRARVTGVVNPDAVGSDAAAAVGMPERGPVPVTRTLAELIAGPSDRPTRVLIAIAPPGGMLPAAMRADVETALTNGIPVLSGLHTFLADDPEFVSLASTHGTPIVDLRLPPDDPVVATGAGRLVPVPVIATVGTDCRCGKMTVAVALREAARAAGLRAAFVATGQTGLLLEPESGAPVDRVIADFVAGEVERQVMAAARLDAHGQPTDATPDFILVEGQGALSHPAYAAVTMGLLHGAWPDALIMCHAQGRTTKTIATHGPSFPVLAVEAEIRLTEQVLAPVRPARVAAVALAAPTLDPTAFERARKRIEDETGLPAFDVLRDGGGPLLEALIAHIEHAVPQKRRAGQTGRRAVSPGPIGAHRAPRGRAMRASPGAPRLPRAQWLCGEDRVVILAHRKWGLFTAKTGVQVLRFSRARVVAVVDPAHEGEDAARLVGLPDKSPVPIHGSLGAALAALAEPPTRVVVGVAPAGGRLPKEMRRDVEDALAAGIPVVSGMHTFLGDDPQLAALAAGRGAAIVDLRRPPGDPVVANGIGRSVPVPVITTIGTDCDSGKMTVAVALRDAAHRAGLNAAFVATGQTGLLLEPDAGVAVDHLISDFLAGEVERQVLAAARLDDDGQRTADSPDIIIVEGQGALSHPAYGAVTAGLLHGSWPDVMVLAHVHGRTTKLYATIGEPFPVLHPAAEAALAEAFLAPVWPARVAAIALAAPMLGDAEHAAACARLAEETRLPVHDVVRHGADGLLDAVIAAIARRKTPRIAPHPAPRLAPER